MDYFIAEEALEMVNGDGAFVEKNSEHLFLGIIDGAGHGPKAHKIAQSSCDFLKKNKHLELPNLMSELHEYLRGTIGGVSAIGKLDYQSLQFRYVSIGNIVIRRIGKSSKRVVSQDGIIGYHIRTPQEKCMQLMLDDVLIMHTDGITSYFDENDYPKILRDDAETIAKTLINKFGKNNDDATCIVLRVT